MSRIAYVNGRYVPHRRAVVHVEDRGYQFADGVYEVIAITNGKFIDEEPHLDRLDRSLSELEIDTPLGRSALRTVMREVARRNRVRNGIVYLQITRGVAPRDHGFPAMTPPALVITARSQAPKRAPQSEGIDVVTVPDIRWKRRDIKSISLLPNILAKQTAVAAGAYEAWMVEADGTVTEGSATNAWIVSKDKELITRPPDNNILNGITRQSLRDLAVAEGYSFVERPFTVEEAMAAKEVFITSTTSWVMPVVRIDDQSIANGEPGSLTRSLQAMYVDYIGVEAG